MADEAMAVPRSCSLDAAGVQAQGARYRRAGEGAVLLRSDDRRLEVVVGEGADRAEVDQLVAVERECCPFFEIDWAPDTRRLSFGVSRDEDSPALGAIEHALGLHGHAPEPG